MPNPRRLTFGAMTFRERSRWLALFVFAPFLVAVALALLLPAVLR